VPYYNAHEWFEETLESLNRQTLEDFEAIIVEDASTDEVSLKAIQDLEGRFPQLRAKGQYFRILHHSQNQGLSGARNTGVKHGKSWNKRRPTKSNHCYLGGVYFLLLLFCIFSSGRIRAVS
jgi:glycosyltransferase involved in cell wall biosynthesis